MNGLMIKLSLTFVPINAIFIVVKYHDRIEAMIEEYKESAGPFIMKNY